MNPALTIVLGLLASVGAGVCAYADGALLAVDADTPGLSGQIAALVARRDRAHRALAFARVALQVAAGAACAVAVQASSGLAKIPLLLLLAGGLAMVVLSETTARDVGERSATQALERVVRFVDVVERGLVAVVLLGEWMDRGLASFIPPPPANDAGDEATIAQFREVVASEADVSTQESSILAGVFSLGDTTVAEVMTPRVDIVGVERDSSWADVLARVRHSEHSRVVVHDGSLDHVVGVLHAKDLLPFVAGNDAPPGNWTALVRPTAFIPASKRADAQLREFRHDRRHMAIVVDEFGGTAGLVTIEDLLRIVVRGIRDEFDEPTKDIEERGSGRYRVPGRLTLERVSEAIGDDLRHEEVTTIGGLVYELLGRIPHPGDSAQFRSWRLVVERVQGRRVESVGLERTEVPAGVEEEQ